MARAALAISVLAWLVARPALAAGEPMCSYATPQYCSNVASLFGCAVPATPDSLAGTATGIVVIPYVPLVADPGDAGLDATLTADQQALLGCGPDWGTDCDAEGIDLTKAATSVLLQSFPGIVGGPIAVRGARGPGDPGYDPSVDGSADGLVQPFTSTPFASEMAALSWNMLMTLVAFSQAPDPDAVAPGEFDPNDPLGTEPGQCSYAQPQYCAAVQCLIAPEPGSVACGLAAALALRSLGRRRRSERGRSGFE